MKMISASAYLLLTFAVTASASAALVARWDMNEVSGDLADSSGNNITATASGGAGRLSYLNGSVDAGTYGAITITEQQAVNFGTSIQFIRGASGVGGYFSGSSSMIEGLAESGTPTAGSGSFTIMGWINPQSLPANQRIFSTSGSAAGAGYALGIGNYAGSASSRLKSTNIGVVDIVTSVSTITVGSWQHVALVWENGQSAMYINGVLVSPLTASAGSRGFLDEGNLDFRIGDVFLSTSTDATRQYFDGYMDELKIFTTALTGAEIISNATASAVPEPSMGALGMLGALVLLSRRSRQSISEACKI